MKYPASHLTPFPPTFPRNLFTSFADVSPLITAVFPQPNVYPQPRHFPRSCAEAQKSHFLSPLFAALTHSLSRNSFPCHSYANTRGVCTTPPKSFSPLVHPDLRGATRHSPLLPLTPFRINTCISVASKRLYLPLESTLMKKRGGGGASPLAARRSPLITRHFPYRAIVSPRP